MAKTTVKVSEEQASGLKLLKKKRLYKARKPRAAPTRYALNLLKTLGDVISGKASVVTVNPPKEKGKRKTKGVKLAREIAGENTRTIGNKIIVPVRKNLGEHAVLNKKTKKIDIVRNTEGGTYRRTLLSKRIKTVEDIPVINPETQTFAVPFYRGKGRPVDFVTMTYDELVAFWNEYGSKASKREFKNLGKLIQISTFEHAPEFEDEDEELTLRERLDERGEVPNGKPKRRKRKQAKK